MSKQFKQCETECPNSDQDGFAGGLQSSSEKIVFIIADLKRRGAAKPRAVKTLTSTISNMFQKQLSDEELQSLLLELQTKGIVSIAGTKVSYELPA